MKIERKNLLHKLKDIPNGKDLKELSFSVSNIELLQSSDEDEGKEKKKRAKITAMVSGWNRNDTFFSKNIISQLPPMIMRKPKLYLNHDMFAFMGRNVDEWLATYVSCEYKDEGEIGKVEGLIEFTNNPKTVWIYDEIEKDPSNVHFSTHLRGLAAEDEEIEGRKGQVVKMLVDYKSTDCVSYGAAGGVAIEALSSLIDDPGFMQLLNSSGYELKKLDTNETDLTNINNNNQNKTGEDDMEIKTIADLKANVPSEILNAFIGEEVKKELTSKENATKLELLNTVQVKLQDVEGKLTEKEKEVVGLKETITTLTNEKIALATKVDEIAAAEALLNWKTEVDKAIKDSEIDERLVTEVFRNSLYDEKKIEVVNQLIEDRKAIQTGNIINAGSGFVKKGEKEEIKPLTDEELISNIKNY